MDFPLPDNIPAPVDDGGCDHLPGMTIPSMTLPTTDGKEIDLASLKGRTVVYIYPMTGRPDRDLPDGWNDIPGARGCTPQSCAFRDHHTQIKGFNADVFGLSAQTTAYQREAAKRLHLPYSLISDEHMVFQQALNLPTFQVDNMTLLKRVTLIIKD